MRSQPPRRSRMSTAVFAASWPAGLASLYGVAIRVTAARVVPVSRTAVTVLLVAAGSLAAVSVFVAAVLVSSTPVSVVALPVLLAVSVSSAQATISAASPSERYQCDPLFHNCSPTRFATVFWDPKTTLARSS